MAAKLPVWQLLWQHYPDYIFYTSEQVKKLIGGNVDAAWITNTCAIRLSRTLNYNSIPVPRNRAGLATVRGGDNKRYAFRVREMTPWLENQLGRPDFDVTKRAGDSFDKNQLRMMKGIIGFNIRFSDATGHLDVWDGHRFTSEHLASRNYWESATRIWLWQAG